MNAYLTYDRIQEEREREELGKSEKDEWIRDKADELAEEFPETVCQFYNHFLTFNASDVGLNDDAAQDAYVRFIEEVCIAKSVQLWGEKELNKMADYAEEVIAKSHRAQEAA